MDLVLMLVFVVLDSRLDGVFGQNRTVDFYRWQGKFFGNLRVANVECLVERFTFYPFGNQRAGRNGGPATVGFKARVFNDAGVVDLDLKFHDVATGGSAHHAG